jgi:hypothetical protein
MLNECGIQAECRYPKSRYPECRGAFTVQAKDVTKLYFSVI